MAAKTSTTKTNKPIADITKPDAATDDQKLVISNRPVMNREEDAEQSAPEPTAASAPKRTVIKPLTMDEASEEKPEGIAETPPEPAGAAQAPAETAEPETSEPAEPAEPEESAPADGAPTNKADLSAAETKKLDREAEQQAAEEAKRQEELQKYIDNHEYYVPINAVAQRRSIKVSIGLTFVVLLLSILLIDLMLDSGVILLVQKIPHTHFFGLN